MPDAEHAAGPGQSMIFVDACPPVLGAGAYEVTVSQTLTHQKVDLPAVPADPDARPPAAPGTPTFSRSPQRFWVSAPRFTLPSSDVYAMYPPADARGRFSEALPHVILKRRTLPWERQLSSDSPTRPDQEPPRPWMALLLLDEDQLGLHAEIPLKPESRPLRDVRMARRPALAPEPGEKDEARCTTIDISSRVFWEVAPAWEDLPYLAHGRHVGAVARERMDTDGIEDDGWFSVVVGNRQPVPGKEHGVYLVSLEGLEKWLPRQGATTPPDDVLDPLRLVVLASWRFVDDSAGSGFRELATGLRCDPLRLPVRADATLASALALGYAPLAHRTRQGRETVSWYRGPLVPHFLPTDAQNMVYACADAAVRYDSHTGLLDVSYAAAWQLGRLLGLRNQPFALAVQRSKLRAVQGAARAATRKMLAARFGDAPAWAGSAWSASAPSPGDLAGHWNDLAARFLRDQRLSGAEARQAGDLEMPASPDHSQALREAIADGSAAAEMPLEVRQFLGRLFLLHGVPLGYLVPHPELLPPESLRAFFVDTGWIGALLDGALSIARVSESQLILDKAMTGRFLADLVRDEVRTGVVAAPPTAGGADLGDPGIASVRGHLTGFLLRSRLVSGWPGLEIEVKEADGTPLRALRLQRVAEDALLAIYDGALRRLVITQPPQGVHFGAPANGALRAGSRALDVRRLAGTRNSAEFAASMLVARVQHTVEFAPSVTMGSPP